MAAKRGRADGRREAPPQSQGENWGLLAERTRERYAQEQADRGYGDSTQNQPSLFMNDPAAAAAGSGVDAGAQIARMEAGLTLKFQAHDKLLASGIDPSSMRVLMSTRDVIQELHRYEQAANPRAWRRLQDEGRRPTPADNRTATTSGT